MLKNTLCYKCAHGFYVERENADYNTVYCNLMPRPTEMGFVTGCSNYVYQRMIVFTDPDEKTQEEA